MSVRNERSTFFFVFVFTCARLNGHGAALPDATRLEEGEVKTSGDLAAIQLLSF